MYYVYLLATNKGKTYIGCTSDLRRRYKEHSNKEVYSTKNDEYRLVYYEAYVSKKDALRREKRLKDGRANNELKKRVHESIQEVF